MSKGASLLLGLALGASATGLELIPPASAHPPTLTPFIYNNAANQGRSTISVTVYGESRRPLNDIYVELLNEYTTIDRQKTSGAGRAIFNNLSDGNYKVRVLPYGTEYTEQTKEVTLINYSIIPGHGFQNEQVDMYLKAREGLNSGPFAAPPGAIFVQNVPGAAKKLFDQGVVELREKKEKEGFESLRKAIEIFPTYYVALERLGTEYVMRGTPAHYEAARMLLTKAVEVNPRGFSSVFGLGLAQYKLKMVNEAIDNLKRATSLHAQSADAQLYLGMAFNQAGRTAEAEAAFKRANVAGKGKGAEAHFQLARLYSAQNRYSEAADELELYLKNNPGSPDTDKMRQTIQQLREKAAKK